MVRKVTIGGLILLVGILLLCIFRILPNIPILTEYGIYCDCQEIVETNKQRYDSVIDTIEILTNDTIKLSNRIEELEKQLEIVHYKYKNAINDLDSLQNTISNYQEEINQLKTQLEIANTSLNKAIGERDSVVNLLDSVNQAWQDSIAHTQHIQRQNDSIVRVNAILQNVNLINLKAYTSRNSILDKVNVNQISIKYCISGINFLQTNLGGSSIRVFFKIKTKDGIYKIRGEKTGTSDIEDQYRLYDVVVYSKLKSNEYVATAVYPNWQKPFNIFEKYTIESYIILNETEIFLGAITQDLKIKERTYSLDEID